MVLHILRTAKHRCFQCVLMSDLVSNLEELVQVLELVYSLLDCGYIQAFWLFIRGYLLHEPFLAHLVHAAVVSLVQRDDVLVCQDVNLAVRHAGRCRGPVLENHHRCLRPKFISLYCMGRVNLDGFASGKGLGDSFCCIRALFHIGFQEVALK